MKTIFKIIAIISILFFQFSCKSTIEISPKTATIIVPAKGEIKLFDNIEHNSFSINLTNKSILNSCEAFTVKNGSKKWISPSLLANKQLDFSVSSSAYVLLQNYSNENISVVYTID
jgi:hypothetical protein